MHSYPSAYMRNFRLPVVLLSRTTVFNIMSPRHPNPHFLLLKEHNQLVSFLSSLFKFLFEFLRRYLTSKSTWDSRNLQAAALLLGGGIGWQRSRRYRGAMEKARRVVGRSLVFSWLTVRRGIVGSGKGVRR
jgi:hypothetical protein